MLIDWTSFSVAAAIHLPRSRRRWGVAVFGAGRCSKGVGERRLCSLLAWKCLAINLSTAFAYVWHRRSCQLLAALSTLAALVALAIGCLRSVKFMCRFLWLVPFLAAQMPAGYIRLRAHTVNTCNMMLRFECPPAQRYLHSMRQGRRVGGAAPRCKGCRRVNCSLD